ncbi:MAG: c-type cytochrome [Bdellovibrionota bacterium]
MQTHRLSPKFIFFLNLIIAQFAFPFVDKTLAAERGSEVFNICAACHGPAGEGNLALQAPSIAGLPAWYVQAQIEKFRTGARGAHPKDVAGLRMRSMARALYNKEDIESVSKYVESLKLVELKKDTVMESKHAATEIKGSVIAGEERYKLCSSCHGPEGKGMQAIGGPPLTQSSDWYLLKQLKNFKQGIRGGDAQKDPTGATMKGMAATLDEQAMKDVITYIQTLR